MRKINTLKFNRATRSTPREINRQIVLNLVRELQPISRAEVARRMEVGRGMVTSLVDELLAEGAVYEGETGNAPRGRKPKLLHVRSHDRYALAVDVRFTRTYLMLADFDGKALATESFATIFSPVELVAELAERVRRVLRVQGIPNCEGIGIVVPGMVDRRTGRVLFSPQLGWEDVELKDALAAATGFPVHIENAPTACALSYVWLSGGRSEGLDSFVYVTVNDGVGAGMVVNGRLVRGFADSAGEFGHVALSFDGPICLCGQRGCLEAYSSNLTTLARYLGVDLADAEARRGLRSCGLTVPELVTRAREGDASALAALTESAHYLGIGLAGIINAVNPARIVIGGEITGAWDLISATLFAATRSRALTRASAATPIVPEDPGVQPRLRGATALVVAPVFAAPEVA